MKKEIKLTGILLSVTAIGVLLLLPHSGLIPVPFGYCIPMFLLAWLFLKYKGETFSDTGFSLKNFHFRAVLIGSLTAVLLFLFLQYLFFPVLGRFIKLQETDVELYRQLRGNTGFYIFLLVMGWIVGGFYEEIIFHGFIFTRIEKIIPGKYATLTGFILTGILFGLYHLQLGTEGMINAFIAGLVYHGIILFNKRNIWHGIFCHAVFDTIVITLLYLEYI